MCVANLFFDTCVVAFQILITDTDLLPVRRAKKKWKEKNKLFH